jgi:TolB protein
VECFLYVSKSKDLLLGESYTVPQRELRRAMHAFFDQVTKRLCGERGVASTKLAYVSKIEGVKQVVVSDYDGFHRTQITRDTSISMMPVWTLGNKGLVYVNFKTNRPRLYTKVFGRSEQPLFTQFDQTYSPAVNPKTGELLFSSTKDGKTDLYIGSMESGKARKFAYLKSNQTSPAWSPFATEVLFTSDRGGGPQIFVMGKDGSDLRRVTFMGRYNERASWSPSGDRIVYTSMDNGKMNIYTCALDGSDIMQLTNNAGNNEHPTWSPDGKLIAFSSNRSGSYQIYIMRFDGANVTRITQGGENTAPTWSWFYEDNSQTTKEGAK